MDVEEGRWVVEFQELRLIGFPARALEIGPSLGHVGYFHYNSMNFDPRSDEVLPLRAFQQHHGILAGQI